LVRGGKVHGALRWLDIPNRDKGAVATPESELNQPSAERTEPAQEGEESDKAEVADEE